MYLYVFAMVDSYWTTPLLVILGIGGFQWGLREELSKGLCAGEKQGHCVSKAKP